MQSPNTPPYNFLPYFFRITIYDVYERAGIPYLGPTPWEAGRVVWNVCVCACLCLDMQWLLSHIQPCRESWLFLDKLSLFPWLHL